MTSLHNFFKAHNFKPSRDSGQNFLIDPATAERIVEKAGLEKSGVLVEIGAGMGALTIPASRKVKRVYAVEKDRRVMEFLRGRLAGMGIQRVELINGNILYVDFREFAENGEGFFVMGNLPYNISSQIVLKLINERRFIKKAVIMLQKEVARRLLSSEGCREYGRLTVILGYHAGVRRLMEVKAGVFHPKPRVDSTVMEILFRGGRDNPARDEKFFSEVVKAAFGKRRKTLKNALSGSRLNIGMKGLSEALEEAGIEGVRRAESLSVDEFVNLSNALGARAERPKMKHSE